MIFIKTGNGIKYSIRCKYYILLGLAAATVSISALRQTEHHNIPEGIKSNWDMIEYPAFDTASSHQRNW